MGRLKPKPYKTIGETEIIDGLLTCQCGMIYIVHQGVPRMLPSLQLPVKFTEIYHDFLLRDAPMVFNAMATNSTENFSFSYQWSKHPYDDLTWELSLPERVNIFYRYFDMTPGQANGERLLDAGCGNGTLSAQLALEGFEVVAMDYSNSIFKAFQYKIFETRIINPASDRLHYLQGNVQHPPFEKESFDLNYSDGVLHHTPDTKLSFLALCKLVKPGGRFFVYLYRSDTKITVTIKHKLVYFVRYLTRNISHANKMRLCYLGAIWIMLGVRVANIFGYRKRRIIPIRSKAVNLFDTISPQFNHEHTPEEVRAWFIESGYHEVKEVTISEFRLNEGGFAMIGTK
jgi:2-polyprenyl-3-methyl-5-hydroxy-6-metoxy-1,4-benzoquinol methylase